MGLTTRTLGWLLALVLAGATPGAPLELQTNGEQEVQPQLESLLGTYARHLGSRQAVTITLDDGQLRARDPRGGGGLLTRDDGLRFRFPGGQVVTFERDPAGGVESLVVNRGARSMTFYRLEDLEAEYEKRAGASGPHALSDAILAGDARNVRKLIDEGADLRELDTRPGVGGRNGRRPLNWAAIQDDVESVALLLDGGVGVDEINRSGMTALHHAAEAGSPDAARLLIERGADRERKTTRGQTALQIAMRRGHEDIVELLRTADTAGGDCSEPCAKVESLYEIPEVLGDGLQVASLGDVGASQKPIDTLLADLEVGVYDKVDSLLVLKDGKLVVERYFGDWNVTKPHQMQSVSKSFTSLLAGSAILQGHIAGVEEPLVKYLLDHRELLTDGREAITIEHLLTMSAGLDWNEMSSQPTDPENARLQEVRSEDSVGFTLSRELVDDPGSVFNYSGGVVTVLGEVVRHATESERLLDYVEQSTLATLEMGQLAWLAQMDGRQNAAGGLMLRPRDLAKIGLLMLRDGVWDGERLLPEGWVDASLDNHIDTPADWDEYGYLWWGRTYQSDGHEYSVDAARGWGGQLLILVRELDLAVVMTATNFAAPTALDPMMTGVILPAFGPAGGASSGSR